MNSKVGIHNRKAGGRLLPHAQEGAVGGKRGHVVKTRQENRGPTSGSQFVALQIDLCASRSRHFKVGIVPPNLSHRMTVSKVEANPRPSH